MTNDQEKVIAVINQLAAAVVDAIRSGSAEERKRLIFALGEMDALMPSVSEETAETKEFIRALIGLLEGKPISQNALVEPYAGIYAKIASRALGTETVKKGPSEEQETREFLTQISATVVLAMKNGTDEERAALAVKLREIHGSMTPEKADEGRLVLALVSLLEGASVDPDALPAPYSSFFRKILGSIR